MMKNDAPATGSDPKPLHAPAAARWREIGRLAAVCAVATLLVLVGISAYFNVIYATLGPEPTGTPTPAPPTGTPTPSPIPTPTPPWVRSFTLADLPAGPETLVFTEDGTRAAALKDGVVTVLDTATGKTVETLTEPAPITSCYLMVDQSILVYFYMDATDHTLKVSTYNFVTSLHYVRQTVPFPAGTTLKLTDYSKGMSFVVYQTATTGGSSTTYDLGWLNTSSHVRYTSIHHAMVRMLATNLIFHIYSESPAHALYQDDQLGTVLTEKALAWLGEAHPELLGSP